MNHLQGFGSIAYGFGLIKSRSLSSMQPDSHANATTPDGSRFFSDSDGNVVYAQYASGAIVSRNENHVSVRTACGDYWLGNFEGQWFRLD